MPDLTVRRATIEDLPSLTALWDQAGLHEPNLEKRFKDFQLAESDDGELVGAIAIHMHDRDALVVHEIYAETESADSLRSQLWNRVLVVARNFGLCRLWTQLDHPFYQINGFQAAPPEMLEKLPPAFAKDPKPWLVIQLRDESATLSLDKEFALFKESELESTQKIFRQARVLKTIAFILASVLAGLVILWAVLFLNIPRAK